MDCTGQTARFPFFKWIYPYVSTALPLPPFVGKPNVGQRMNLLRFRRVFGHSFAEFHRLCAVHARFRGR